MRTISYRIEIDDTQSSAALRQTERLIEQITADMVKMGKTTDDVAKAQEKLSVLNAQQLDRVAKGVTSVNAEYAKWSREQERVAQTTKTQTGVMDNALASLGRRLVAVFAVERIISFGASVITTAGKIQDLSDKTGLSTTAIQKFGYAANLTGGSIDGVANAIGLMSKSLVSGTGGAVAALDRLGLSQRELMRMRPEDAFVQIAEAIRGMNNPMEQADVAMKIFGRSGREILPMIKAGITQAGDEAERLGAIMSEQTIKDLDALGDAWTKTWAGMQGWTARVFATLVQTKTLLATMWDAVPDWVKKTASAGTTFGAWNIFQYGMSLAEGQRPATSGPRRTGDIGLSPDPLNLGFTDSTSVSAAAPVITLNHRLADSKRDVARATREATVATEDYLRSLMPLIGVNRSLLNEAYSKYGVAGLMPGFGAVPGVPSMAVQVGLPADAAARLGMGAPGFGAVPAGGVAPGFWGRVGASNNWNGTTGAVAAGAMQGMQVAEGVGQFWQSTDVAGRGNRAWAGAKSGAQIGSAFGPWGALIGMGVGALVGALRNPGFEQEMKRISRNFGVDISEQLARSIDKLRKEFSGDRVAAEIFSIDKIIGEAGGVTDENVARLTARLRDVFVMVDMGKFSTEQATDTLDKAFGYFAEHLEKSGKLASKQFLELIELNARMGTESSAIADFVRGQVDGAAAGLQQYLENATVTSQEAANGVTSAVLVMFGTLREQGVSLMDIFDQLGPSIETLKAQLDAAGLSGGEAFQTIADLAAYAADEAVGKAAAATDGLTQLMKGLHNGAMLSQDSFSGLSRAVYDVYRNLELQGKGGEQAWRMMQPSLQQIWELQQKFGYTVDDVTQNLINQAKAAGLIGDQFKPAGELMKDLLTDIKAILGDIRDAFVGVGDAARTAGQEAANAFDGALPTPGSGGNGGEYYQRGGVVYAAKGWPWVPRGTDTVPAMLTPGEGVLSRRGMQALGALNSGGLPGGRGGITVNVDMRGSTNLEDSNRTADRIADAVSQAFRRELGRNGVTF